ncbi:hypothetical protein HBH56_027670 [Parastagonospora nodorum]|uniref:Cytochrome P450 n=2 Tax=Phaeosphaeria nodorum (strain SN15 / ATCC MYA-4574 / FGSC 10173) TaxID=321614 RepID=A0A7U2F9L6_PHANO|nr:hypothetical protein HBH56_027670 [Parastagonospora nodorum]QRC99050.1 hypothetical protein JI435_063960 [Parastagonospora nodorum SN15]KAH3934413.1 hypothetical protein HBH54_054380 [Parastagonospora nodorum]KAH4039092.1 hypothetical protein HBI09_043780 [Parastagonospora nodorum]KAH4141776.1 hypothetical protein HBH45_062410 [Parastagonospora nodorum]
MADTNYSSPIMAYMASTTLCAMHAPPLHLQAPADKFVAVAPFLLPPVQSLSHSNLFSSWTWHWAYLVYALLLWQITYILHTFWWKAPTGVIIAAHPTVLGRYFTALQMIFDSETLLQRAYDSSNGQPFAIPMTDRWIVYVSDHAQLKTLESEPETVLSMEQALHELAFTGPILGHLQVKPEHKGPKSEGFRVMIGVLKNKLRSNIPVMSAAFRKSIEDAFTKEVEDSKKNEDGWSEILMMPSLLRVFTRVNLLAFLGEDQAGEIKVYDDIMSFFWSCAKAFPIVNLMPQFTMPLISPIAMGFGITRRVVYNLILRLTSKSVHGTATNKMHITHWVAEVTKLHDIAAIARITLGLLFASAFQVPMIAQFVIYRLCIHPEYTAQLRAEAESFDDAAFTAKNEEMPYLDSFIKETSRLSPGPILSAPRAVMHDYTTSSGAYVPRGNWLAIPQIALMRDEAIWTGGAAFDGFRFVSNTGNASDSRWTHPSYEYPFWGSIRHACPARFYVSVVMKMILGHILKEYEFKLRDEGARPCLTFGKVRLPSPFMVLLVKKRTV